MIPCFDLFHTIAHIVEKAEEIYDKVEPYLEVAESTTLEGRLNLLQRQYIHIWRPFFGEPSAERKIDIYGELQTMLGEAERFVRAARHAGRHDLVLGMRRLEQDIRNSTVYREMREPLAGPEPMTELMEHEHETVHTAAPAQPCAGLVARSALAATVLRHHRHHPRPGL